MSTWQLFVKGLEGKTSTIPFTRPFKDLYVRDIMEQVEVRTGIPPADQCLIHGGKQMQKDQPLTFYKNLGRDSTIFLVLRLPGGATAFSDHERTTPSGLPPSKYPCMLCGCHPNDDDEEPYPERRMPLMMPCKSVRHIPLHPHCLMMYAHNEVYDNKKLAICCPVCGDEWSLGVVERYGVATKEEIRLLEETLSISAVHSEPSIRECPNCRSYCMRKNKSDIRVCCYICKKIGKSCEFCWHCMKHWTGSSTTECPNPECNSSEILAFINSAPEKEVVGVKCPSIRLCPNCGIPTEHMQPCKQMTCRICKCQFCFICLRQTRDGSWQCGSYNTQCTPAPRQERVPVRK